MAASYRHAVEWIALNDEPEVLSVDDMEHMISVLLVADIFGRSSAEVARAVIHYRERGAHSG